MVELKQKKKSRHEIQHVNNMKNCILGRGIWWDWVTMSEISCELLVYGE